MEIPVRINFENMEPSADVRAKIEHEVRHLESIHRPITDCSVTIIGPNTRHRSGEPHQVTIRLAIPPHQDVVVSRRRHDEPAEEHLSVAIKEAFAAAKRQFEQVARRMRGEVKSHST
jgi:hypothetical protein